MPETFNCPNCGAPLDYHGSDPIIRCPYCISSVIVPENLRGKPAFSSKASNFTLSGKGDLGGLINQARRIKEVKELAEAGEMDQAVDLYRSITGADDFSARQAVGKLSAGQPITFTGINAAEVTSSVQVTTAAPKVSRNIGRWIGCGVTLLVLGIFATALIPLAGTMLGLFAISNGIKTQAPGVENPIVVPIAAAPTPTEVSFAAQELSFGGEGTGPGLFGDVRALAVNPVNGNIYAANYDDGRVQAFDSQGKFITQWIIPKGNTEPYFDDMAVDRNGTVYIPVFGKIMRFDGSGNALPDIKIAGSHIDNLDIAADGSLVAIADGETILWLSAEGKLIKKVKAAISTISDDPELDAKIAVDGLGNVYVLGTFSNAVFVFGPDGKFANRFGGQGNENGQFSAAYTLAIDGTGRIFVSDNKGVQVFSSDGRYIDRIKVKYFAFGLAFDDQGLLTVITNQKKIEKYRITQ